MNTPVKRIDERVASYCATERFSGCEFDNCSVLHLFPYIYKIGNMKKESMITALSALAQETRLDIFRYLVEVGPDGVSAGTIGERFDLPSPTLSFHLKTLQQAGLLERQRRSRSLIYSANFATMNALLAYLTENCCGGHPQACEVQSPTHTTTTTTRKRA
jgi:DNA-binding transcriptional ArsR family regulator